MIQTFVINKENIDLFEHPEWQRNIRTTNINRFKKVLLQKQFLGSLITVNKINNKFRLINGNHRIKAIKEVIDKLFEVTLVLDIYENLTEAQEREIFSKISIETPQTLDDFLYIYRTDIPYFNKISEDFPIRIVVYSYENAVRLSTITKIIKSVRNKNLEFDFKAIKREDALEILKSMKEPEFKYLYKFFELFKGVVGGVINNSLYKPIVLVPLADIYGRYVSNPFNKVDSQVGWHENDWKKLFTKIMTDHIILSIAQMNTSREKMREVRERILFLARNKCGSSLLI